MSSSHASSFKPRVNTVGDNEHSVGRRVVQNRGTTRVPAQGRLFWVPTWAVFARVLEYPDTGSGDVSVILNIPASSFTSPLFGVEFRVDPSPTLIDVYCLI